jgi:hypothetical protein
MKVIVTVSTLLHREAGRLTVPSKPGRPNKTRRCRGEKTLDSDATGKNWEQAGGRASAVENKHRVTTELVTKDLCMQCKKPVENSSNRFNILESFSEVSTVSTGQCSPPPVLTKSVTLPQTPSHLFIQSSPPKEKALLLLLVSFDFLEDFPKPNLVQYARAREANPDRKLRPGQNDRGRAAPASRARARAGSCTPSSFSRLLRLFPTNHTKRSGEGSPESGSRTLESGEKSKTLQESPAEARHLYGCRRRRRGSGSLSDRVLSRFGSPAR